MKVAQLFATVSLLSGCLAVVLRGSGDEKHPVRPIHHFKKPEKAQALSRYGYSKDCSLARKRGHSMSALEWEDALNKGESLPGVGMDLDLIKPYETVYKDGFYYVTCAKDILFHHGDLHGNGKFSYNLKDISNVSIIHYTEMIPKEDRETMTHEVCFAFCRSIKHMNFFGIHDGRDCYCAPFFEKEPGDSSECDAVCEGDATTNCGGMTKSAVFEMHMCNSMSEDLKADKSSAEGMEQSVRDLADNAETLADHMQDDAKAEQEMWGAAGDPNAAALMQKTKQWAGEILAAATPAHDACDDLKNGPIAKATSIENNDFLNSDNAVEAEGVIEGLEKGKYRVKATKGPLQDLYDEATRGLNATGTDRGAQYYPIMYFVDKDFVASPTTCSGDWDGRTIYKATYEDCATACDGQTNQPECSGFMLTESGLCFLFSKFKTVQYYTKCGQSFLQESPDEMKQELAALEAEEKRARQHAEFLRAELAKQKITKAVSANKVDNHCEGVAKKCAWTRPKRSKPALIQQKFGGRPFYHFQMKADNVLVNNLDGSDSAKDPIIMIANIADGINLKIETTTSDYKCNKDKNEVLPNNIFNININGKTGGSKVDLKFTFLNAKTGQTETIDNFDFTVMDFDGGKGKQETVTISGFDRYYVNNDNNYLTITESNGDYTFKATQEGFVCDNPVHPDNLGPTNKGKDGEAPGCEGAPGAGLNRLEASVGFNFKQTSSFEWSYDAAGGIRQILWTFSSQATRLTNCYAKLEDFEGTDLSPDPSGKNKLSLTEAKKADRCYKD